MNEVAASEKWSDENGGEPICGFVAEKEITELHHDIDIMYKFLSELTKSECHAYGVFKSEYLKSK
jgi:hypothetical protein